MPTIQKTEEQIEKEINLVLAVSQKIIIESQEYIIPETLISSENDKAITKVPLNDIKEAPNIIKEKP